MFYAHRTRRQMLEALIGLVSTDRERVEWIAKNAPAVALREDARLALTMPACTLAMALVRG